MKPYKPIKASRRHDHVYAIVRYDYEADDELPIDLRITVKKVVTDGHFADAEVKRLNDLSTGKGSHYFCQITRIEKQVLESIPVGQDQIETVVPDDVDSTS